VPQYEDIKMLDEGIQKQYGNATADRRYNRFLRRKLGSMLKRGLELVIEAAVDWEIGCGQSPMGWRVMEK